MVGSVVETRIEHAEESLAAIAAHARSLGLRLVTNHTAEFGRVKGLTLENWTLPVRRSRSTPRFTAHHRLKQIFNGVYANALVKVLDRIAVATGADQGRERYRAQFQGLKRTRPSSTIRQHADRLPRIGGSVARSASAKHPVTLDEPNRSARKRRAILDAATAVFLRAGYLGTNMDEIAALSEVSKQTVYKQFASKEALFIEIVTSMTGHAGDVVHGQIAELDQGGDLEGYLVTYGYRQLTVVLTPPLMQLRRLVIGEVSRFPYLARVLHDRGPKRAIGLLAAMFERLAARGLLAIDDPLLAASQFNWLIMAAPLNQAMLLGDEAIPKPAVLRRHAADGVRVFLAAYGKQQPLRGRSGR